ncbi:hypothetical protein [Krasilnikovia sp. MM14-A1004]|uniref:hypothetical protein n=1 Tax=Krasilnikovia sp. MM14-A1004 TaxID=3373541 RepID=UPI00399CAEEA
MLRAQVRRLRAVPPAELLLIAILAALALAVRLVGRHEFTPDMRIFAVWYGKLQAAGGLRGLGEPIGNYNAPFLYLLALLTYVPGPLVLKAKALWLVFDALLVFFTYRIVALRHPGWRIPLLAAFVMAFLPTVVINSSFYGQCDAIWGAFGLGGVYYLLRGKPWWGVSLCAVALAFKPQASFLFPLLGLLALAGRLPWRTLLAVPAVLVLLDLPAMLMGRSPVDLLTLYSPARQASWVSALTSSAASVYAFVPVTTRLDAVRALGDVFAAVVVTGVCWILVATRARLDAARIVTAAAFFAMVVPWLLPGMHERYFYLADVLTVVLAFYRPRLWFVPLLVQVASLLSYLPFLFVDTRHGPFVDLRVLAALMFAALLVTGYALLADVRTAPPLVIPAPRRNTEELVDA